MDLRLAGRRPTARGGVGDGQRDILGGGAVHQLRLLQDESDPRVELVGGHRPDIRPPNPYRSLIDIWNRANSAASVDLPDPDGPTSAVTVPGRSVSDTSWITGTPGR